MQTVRAEDAMKRCLMFRFVSSTLLLWCGFMRDFSKSRFFFASPERLGKAIDTSTRIQLESAAFCKQAPIGRRR